MSEVVLILPIGRIRIDEEVDKAIRCRGGVCFYAKCPGCRRSDAIEDFAGLLRELGWELTAVSRRGMAVERLKPPKPWVPEPWQQVFPGPMAGCLEHGPQCIAHTMPSPEVSPIDYSCRAPGRR